MRGRACVELPVGGMASSAEGKEKKKKKEITHTTMNTVTSITLPSVDGVESYPITQGEVNNTALVLRDLGTAGRVGSKPEYLRSLGINPKVASPDRRRASTLYALGKAQVMEQNKATGLAVVGKEGVEVHKFEVKHYKDGRKAFTIQGVEAPKCRQNTATAVKASDEELLAEMRRRNLI